MGVKFNKSEKIVDFTINKLQVGGAGIVTNIPKGHDVNVGDPVIYAGGSVACFPITKTWVSSLDGYRCRKFEGGEELIYNAE